MTAEIAPIAVFAYNRPDHVRRALESLARCARFDECRVTVYCDGPKIPEHEPAVAETRRVVNDWADRHRAEVVERPENIGLARSIVSGVTDLCARFGRVIVVEDDLVVGPQFLAYMLQALDRYENELRVYQVSGFMFPVAHPPAADALLVPMITTWGWATWARAWKVFDWEAPGAREALSNDATRRRFDLDGSYPYAFMLEERLAGRNQSWGILWWWAVFNASGLALHPRRTLVRNDGIDGSGVHCGNDPGYLAGVRHAEAEPWLPDPPRFPETLTPDAAALDRIGTFLRRPGGKRGTRLRRWVRSGVGRLLGVKSWFGPQRSELTAG